MFSPEFAIHFMGLNLVSNRNDYISIAGCAKVNQYATIFKLHGDNQNATQHQAVAVKEFTTVDLNQNVIGALTFCYNIHILVGVSLADHRRLRGIGGDWDHQHGG
jgi:hypothetical protein